MSNAIKLSFYRALVPNVYGAFEVQAAPTADMQKWCNDYDGCIFEKFTYPSSAYTFPVHDPLQQFVSANDNIVVGKWPIAEGFKKFGGSYKWVARGPLPEALMTQMEQAGLYPPYLSLRWLTTQVCPGSTWTTLRATRQPFSEKCMPGDPPSPESDYPGGKPEVTLPPWDHHG